MFRGVWKVWRGSLQVSTGSQGNGQTFPLALFLLCNLPAPPAGNAVLWPWWNARVWGVLCGESVHSHYSMLQLRVGDGARGFQILDINRRCNCCVVKSALSCYCSLPLCCMSPYCTRKRLCIFILIQGPFTLFIFCSHNTEYGTHKPTVKQVPFIYLW